MPKFGDLVTGKVIKIMKNQKGHDIGALIKLTTGETTFLPVREIAEEYVKQIEDYVKLGETVQVRIAGRDKKFNQFSVSIKRVNNEPNPEVVFQKKLERFMKDSGDKLRQIQKNTDRKQNGRKKEKKKTKF